VQRRRHTSPSSPSSFAKRPWHVVTVLWGLLCHAMLPISLAAVAGFVQRFLAEMERPNTKVRPRQIDRMRQLILGGT